MTHHFRFGAISLEPVQFSALQSMADSDPVGLLHQCRKRYKTIQTGTRSLNWELWAACYAGALGIRKQPERFQDLLNHKFFEQRTYAADINDVLRLALIIGTNAGATGPTYKKACYIAARLQPLFDQNVEPEGVLGAIEAAGGLKRLYGDDDASDESQDEAGDDAHGAGDMKPAGVAVSSTPEGSRRPRPSALPSPSLNRRSPVTIAITRRLMKTTRLSCTSS